MVLGSAPEYVSGAEANWMGNFAVNIAVACEIGAARGDYQSGHVN